VADEFGWLRKKTSPEKKSRSCRTEKKQIGTLKGGKLDGSFQLNSLLWLKKYPDAALLE